MKYSSCQRFTPFFIFQVTLTISKSVIYAKMERRKYDLIYNVLNYLKM